MVANVLELALKSGALVKGQEIVEASSGNTGVALAYVGRSLGFKVRVFVASGISPEKIGAIQNHGAAVEKIDVDSGKVSEITCAAHYAKAHGAYFFNQFENPFHIPSYKQVMCPEIVRKASDLGIRIDHFVGGIGSGASLRAVGEFLRAHHNPKLEVHAVAPEIYPSDIEGLNPGHLRKEGHFKIWRDRESDFENGVTYVRDGDAYQSLMLLESDTQLQVGPATGACLWGANNLPLRGNILILLTDHGKKYSQKISKWRGLLKCASPQ